VKKRKFISSERLAVARHRGWEKTVTAVKKVVKNSGAPLNNFQRETN